MTDIWKLQDAKARFSELVRRARSGAPQHVTVHGKDAVIVLDPSRFEVRPKPPQEETMAGFVERSKAYRGPAMKLRRPRLKLQVRDRLPFDEDGQ